MKQFLAKMNISQAVFGLLALVLAFQTIWLTVKWEPTDLFNDVLLIIVWFFYWKTIAKKEDTLVEWNLDDNDKI